MTIGEFIKNKRTEKNLSIQDVSFALKINPRVIKAIENGIKEDLPAAAITKGFIKSYAKFLKVDNVEELNVLIDSEFGPNLYRAEDQSHNLEANINSFGQTDGSSSEDSIAKSISESVKNSTNRSGKQIENSNNLKTPLMLIFAGVVLLLIVAAQKIITKYQKDSAQMTSDLTATQPLASAESNLGDPPNTSSGILPQATNSEPLSQIVNQASDSLNPSAPLENSVDNKADLSAEKEKKLTAEPNAASVETKKETAVSTSSPAPTQSAAEDFKLQNVEVIVEAKGDVEISYASKLSQIGKIKLKTGQVHVFKSKNGLKLIMNDGSLVRTAVNGLDKGLAATSSKPVTIIY